MLYAVFLHDFELFAHEMLLGVSVAIERENTHSCQKPEGFHHFTFLEMPQTSIFVAVFFYIAHDPDASNVSDERPTKSGPYLVSFYLHMF